LLNHRWNSKAGCGCGRRHVGLAPALREQGLGETFSWFGRNRRLAKDYENLADTLAAFITLACIQIAVRRLARP
jgi:transposase